MKSELSNLVSGTNALHAQNLIREYLQALILRAMQREGAFTSLAFHGGTALRFLYDIPRFSEDLDFALELNEGRYELVTLVDRVKNELTNLGFDVSVTVSDKRTVHSAFVKFPGLLFELGLAARREQNLAIKIEVDTRPPAGASLTSTVIRRRLLLHLHHHDRASLLSGKLHAVLRRPYTKGRDVYDLFWYLSDPKWPEPNLLLLNNALHQTGGQQPDLTRENWRILMENHFDSIDFAAVVRDVAPFLERVEEIEWLTRGRLVQLLHRTPRLG